MRKKITITLDADVHRRLHEVVGRSRISRFIESLVRPHVTADGLRKGYRQMALDQNRERDALDWALR